MKEKKKSSLEISILEWTLKSSNMDIHKNVKRFNYRFYNCFIVINDNDVLITNTYTKYKEQPTLYELNIIDNEYLLENIIDKAEVKIPNKKGFYRGVLQLEFKQCNHPMDPIEYESILKLIKLWKYK